MPKEVHSGIRLENNSYIRGTRTCSLFKMIRGEANKNGTNANKNEEHFEAKKITYNINWNNNVASAEGSRENGKEKSGENNNLSAQKQEQSGGKIWQ